LAVGWTSGLSEPLGPEPASPLTAKALALIKSAAASREYLIVARSYDPLEFTLRRTILQESIAFRREF
jgi:hypothetical protein